MAVKQHRPVWLWLNLLSLDAPLVAVVWQDFLARSYPSALRPAGRLMLGLTVWAIYLADRILDVRSPPSRQETLPHQFCRQHHRLAGVMLAVILLADLLIGTMWLRHAVFANGMVVSVGVFAYLGLFPVRQIAPAFKPMAAAMLFTTGVFLVAWTGKANSEWMFGWPAAAFFAVCLANLHLINRWELGLPPARIVMWIVPVILICVFIGASRWYTAIALSAAGLAALAVFGNKLSQASRRVLADAVLLTPLLFR
jgi:hypothetical protein